ncbi:Sugar phosphate isomerase/epimerase [Saccharopolyspora antimicrobica]|uniref:Sugar phosphate isomerase/epimerase n=1 Tax=Saccharopolyspora antimicrobica TaxID=455193 RepID=A0A1I5GJZ1_9PSEU|nr:TIM barrel protein [Saccharopolyspora antimicrobica]RKT87504.1 sugar phosphate isomerase/epimerase [Saccharopolyspora antimicrobica]SFO36308.1 Sugar phosphate isomerase/epimerase [Saccharopolyspora antimicrobica]
MLSVQLYSVRDQLAADRPATLAKLAAIGFRHVEPFGLGSPDRTPAERLTAARSLRTDLDAAGLAVSAVHAGLPGDLAELEEECAILGADTAFVPHPRLVPGFGEETFADPARVDAFADVLGAAAESAELRLGYHNHWFEWARLPDGTTGYDRFWQRTSASLLAELDVYWAVAAGADPAAVLASLGDRVIAVHLKDGPAEPGAPQTPIGTGRVDIPAVLRVAPGNPWHVVEIDTTDLDPFDLLAANATTLTSI